MNEATPDGLPISTADRRKLNRVIEKMIDSPRPMEVAMGGRIANDGYGRAYIRDVRNVPGKGPKGAGNVRVIFDDKGQPLRASHRNKAVRKVELKAMRMARKAAARELRAARAK